LYTGRGKHAKKIFFVKPNLHRSKRQTGQIHDVSALPKDVFYARPHLFPLPRERTLLRTICKHLDAGRANTPMVNGK
jgi:hypothetical protein